MATPVKLIPLEEIAAWLQTADVMAVAKETKISWGTLYSIRRGYNGCTYRTLSILSKYIARQRKSVVA